MVSVIRSMISNASLKYIFYFVCDHVDSILEPACVVPVSNLTDDYFQLNINTRSKVLFHTIPYGYIFRDDWGDTEHNIIASKICREVFIPQIQ